MYTSVCFMLLVCFTLSCMYRIHYDVVDVVSRDCKALSNDGNSVMT